MGSIGRITSLGDLPGDKKLTGYIQRGVALHDSGAPGRPRPAAPKKEVELAVPADLAAALKKNKTAAAIFANFSPSHRKEYIEWITEAKRDETREKRLATTIGWLFEGKPRNWKYISCQAGLVARRTAMNRSSWEHHSRCCFARERFPPSPSERRSGE